MSNNKNYYKLYQQKNRHQKLWDEMWKRERTNILETLVLQKPLWSYYDCHYGGVTESSNMNYRDFVN